MRIAEVVFYKKLRVILSILDILAALLLFVTVDGFIFGSSDDTAFVPWLYSLQNPQLYPTDLRFGSWPNGYYTFYLYYLYIISWLIPIEWVFILSNVIWKSCLLIALRRLTGQISKQEVPAFGIALFIVDGNTQLIAGYHLTYATYGLHFSAIALVLLGISFFISERKWLTIVLLTFAILFNPRLGVFGVGLIFLIWFWKTKQQKTTIIAATALSLIGLTILAYVVWYSSGLDPSSSLNQITKISVYVRSSGHYLPAYWAKYTFLNLALITIFITFIWKIRADQVSQSLCFASLAAIVAIAVGLINNIFFLQPFLVFVNPFEFSPFILAFFYVFAATTLADRIEKGYYISTLLIFASMDLQTTVLLLLLTIVLDAGVGKFPFQKIWTQDLFAAGVGLGVIGLQQLIPEPAWLQTAYRGLALTWSLYIFIVSFGAIVLLFLWFRKLKVATFMGSILLSCLLVSYWMVRVSGVRINYGVNQDWSEVCHFAAQETPLDTNFVIPPFIEDFQYCSQRSIFFSFTHVPLRVTLLPEWINRLRVLQIIPPELELNEINVRLEPDGQIYNNLTTEDFLELKEQYNFIDYVLVRHNTNLALPLLFENASYKLYRLKPYSTAERDLMRYLVETARKNILLDLASPKVMNEAQISQSIAEIGQKIYLEGPIQIEAGPTQKIPALVVDDETRLNGPLNTINMPQGSLAVWARLTNPAKPYADLVRLNTNNDLYIYYQAGGVFVIIYNGNELGKVQMSDDEWHHYVFTWQDGEQNFYIDGLQKLSTQAPASLATTEVFAIGWLGDRDGEQWAGLLAGLMTFDRPLSPDEVLALYQTSRFPDD